VIYKHLHNRQGFFSDYYLGTVFGKGGGRGRKKKLSDRESDFAFIKLQRIRDRAEARVKSASDMRELFVRPLLRDVFGFHIGQAPDNDTHIRPLYINAEDEAASGLPLLLCYYGGWDEGFEGTHTKELLKVLTHHDVRYGLLVSGSKIALVRREGDGPKNASLELDLEGCIEDDDHESFAAALMILKADNFLDQEGGTEIERIEKESREHAQKVSEDLKAAVFTSAESLVQGLLDDWAGRAPDGESRDPLDISEDRLKDLRDAALTCLYRLLFILYAEARDERLLQNGIYKDSYSLESLIDDILIVPPDQFGQNRHGLWLRLIALFEIFDQGLPAITPYDHIPARGGDFFSPETKAGRILKQARLDDRSVARLLLDLATTMPRKGVGRERVSFLELDIEQLGAVYEGLLEFEPKVARETLIEVRVAGKSYALAALELKRLCETKNLDLKGEFDLVAGTAAENLHPEMPVEEDEAEAETEEVESEEVEAEELSGEEDEDKGVKKGATAKLVRRLEPGRFLFIPGSARKGSGSFYTPKPLVDDIVRHAIGPLVQGKTAAEIESLRILDPACGSAHFLVGACRFMARALHGAYNQEYGKKGPPAFRGTWTTDVDDKLSEAHAWCKRRITERCLYGVDLNPTAVELARVSLWIESMAGDRPLTFFEHHVRCGNSLIGTWLERLDQPPIPALKQRGASIGQPGLFEHAIKEKIKAAIQERSLIDKAGDQGAVEPESIEEIRFKKDRMENAEKILAGARHLFDLRCAAAFGLESIWRDFANLAQHAEDAQTLEAYCQDKEWWPEFQRVQGRERFFHWELEFPEILRSERQGFDAVIGNPPWDKILPSKFEFYGRSLLSKIDSEVN